MNAELYGSSRPTDAQTDETVATEENTSETTRVAMENSVLDALRPLLRPKKRRNRDEAALKVEAPRSEAPAMDNVETENKAGSEAAPAQAVAVAKPNPTPDRAPSPPSLGGDLDPVEDEFETFAAIGEDLERRSRQSATLVRLLEQHRQALMTAERERDAAYDKLARVVPVVQETAQALREAMDARKVDEDAARMHRLFLLNGRALDELEKVAVTLFADFLWVKSAWEQYAKSVEEARKLRASLEI